MPLKTITNQKNDMHRKRSLKSTRIDKRDCLCDQKQSNSLILIVPSFMLLHRLRESAGAEIARALDFDEIRVVHLSAPSLVNKPASIA